MRLTIISVLSMIAFAGCVSRPSEQEHALTQNTFRLKMPWCRVIYEKSTHPIMLQGGCKYHPAGKPWASLREVDKGSCIRLGAARVVNLPTAHFTVYEVEGLGMKTEIRASAIPGPDSNFAGIELSHCKTH